MKTPELAERLRWANPVGNDEFVPTDERLLARIVAVPRGTPRAARRLGRRGVTLLAAAVMVAGGVAAAASRFAPEYFGSGDREPTSAAVLAAIRSLSEEERSIPGGLGAVDEDTLVRVAAFDSESGRATVYAAAAAGAGSGFCSVEATGDVIGGGWCENEEDGQAVPYVGHGSSDWGDVRVLLGRLEAPAVRVDVRFEDGRVRAASTRSPWWVHVVGGSETEPGHRPVALIARDSAGGEVATQELSPYGYTARGALQELLPDSDGSPAQNAIRALLERLGSGPWLEEAPVELDRARLLRRIETSAGALEVFTAPWGQGVCYVDASSLISGCPADRPLSDQPTGFDPDRVSFEHPTPSIVLVEGVPPRGAARIRILFEDGSSVAPDILVASEFVAWLGPERLTPGQRPTELVAIDASGNTIARLALPRGR